MEKLDGEKNGKQRVQKGIQAQSMILKKAKKKQVTIRYGV